MFNALPSAAVPASAGRRVLPGFHLALGFTVLYLSLIVLVPLAVLIGRAGEANAGIERRLERGAQPHHLSRHIIERAGGARFVAAAHRLRRCLQRKNVSQLANNIPAALKKNRFGPVTTVTVRTATVRTARHHCFGHQKRFRTQRHGQRYKRTRRYFR